MNPTVLMAVHGRHDLVSVNLNLLSKQKCQIVVVASMESDFKFLRSLKIPHLQIIPANNYPLGSKWQTGVQNCMILGADPLIILGSDDFLSQKFIERASELSQKFDFVYFTKWFIFDQVTLKSYSLRYSMNFPLGSGRIFSRSFLERKFWKLFDTNVNVRLDDFVWDNLNSEDKILNNPEGIALLAVKGKHETMNSLDKILQAERIVWDYCNDIDKDFGFEKPIKELFRCVG